MKERSFQSKRARHLLFFTSFIVTGIMAVLVATTGYSDGINNDPMKPGIGDSYMVYGVKIPNQISFAGEPVPLDLFDVK